MTENTLTAAEVWEAIINENRLIDETCQKHEITRTLPIVTRCRTIAERKYEKYDKSQKYDKHNCANIFDVILLCFGRNKK